MQSQQDSGKSPCRVTKARKCRTKPPTVGSVDKGYVKRRQWGKANQMQNGTERAGNSRQKVFRVWEINPLEKHTSSSAIGVKEIIKRAFIDNQSLVEKPW